MVPLPLPLVGLDRLINEASQSHQSVAETTHNPHKRHPWQDSNPQSQQESGCRPTP